jgi:hypothetical protein
MNSFKTSKRTLIAAALGVASVAATVALAQPSVTGQGSALPAQATGTNYDWVQARLDRMAWRFNLTDEQKAKLKPILEQRQTLRKAQRQAMREQLAQILTPAQLGQWDQMQSRRGWRRSGAFGRGPCGGGQGFGGGPGRGYGPGMGYGPGKGYGPGAGYGAGPGPGATN